MNGRNAKLIRKVAAKAKLTRKKLKQVWRDTPRSERGRLRCEWSKALTFTPKMGAVS